MSIQVQRRRGTAAQNAAFTGAIGEFTWLTDTKQIAGHDGSTAGGLKFPNELNIVNDYFGYASASGTDTITLTVLSAISAYAAGQQFTFKAAATNTGSATLNVNSIGAKTIRKKNRGTGTVDVLEAGDIISGGIYTVRYDGTYMQLIATDDKPAGAYELLSTLTASSSASLDFTSVMNSNYNSYVCVLSDILPATDNVELWLRTSTNNGSSFDSSANNYEWSQNNFLISSAPASAYEGTDSDTKFRMIDDSAGIGNAAACAASGKIEIFNAAGTAANKFLKSEIRYKTSGGGGSTGKMSLTYGHRDATSDIDAFQLLMSSGNIASGSARLYGRRAT